MATKMYDLVVTVGQYTDKQGNAKREYKTIGSVWQNEKGMFAMLDRTFNPAGVPSDRSSLIVGMYEPKDRQQHVPQQPSAPSADFDDDLPF